MKTLKIALLAFAGLFVLLLLAVAVLLLPGVQKSLVARFVATEPGESLEMDFFRVGLNRTEARGIDFRQPDASYQVAEFSADLSLFDLLFRRQLRMGDVVATGVVIDLSHLEPDEDPEPFEGILRQMDLPMPLYMNTINVDGVVLLPAIGEEAVRSHFVLSGGGFAPGREGEIHLQGDLRAPGTMEMLADLGIEGSLTVRQGSGGRIERARLLAQLSASGVELERPERIQADVVLLATDDGEAYQAHFERIAMNEETDDLDLSTLVTLDATFLYQEGLFQGSWAVDVDRDQLATFVGEMELPAFAASGRGDFAYGLDGEVLAVDGHLDISVDDLGVLAEELRELGGFTLNSRFDLRMDEDFFNLEQLVVALRDQEGNELLEARNFQPVRYNRQTEALEGVEERLELAEVTIRGLPVEWANFFLPAFDGPQVLLRGGNLTGQLAVSSDPGGFHFSLVEPLRTDPLTVLLDGEVRLVELSFEVHGAGSFENGQLQGNLEQLRLVHQEELLAAGMGAFDLAAGQANASLQADLARLLNQPLLADINNLSSGVLDLEMALAFTNGPEISLNGSIRDLVTLAEQERVPPVVFEASLREVEENVWDIDLPVRIEGGSSSDVRLAGQVAMGDEVSRFTLNLSGEQLILDQVLALASGFTPPNNNAVLVPGERDEEPFWAGFEGALTVELARLRLQPEYGLEDVEGELLVEAREIVSALRAVFTESPVELDARIRYLTEEDRPYVLEGTLEAPRIAVGEIFRQLQPDRPPTLEGMFVINMELQSVGRNLPDLIDRFRGQIQLQSPGGVIRLLHADNPLAGLGGLAGALFGTLGPDAAAITDIARRLSNMPYDELTIRAERDEGLNYVLRDFSVLSPEMHLRGTGEIQHRENVDLLRQPMTIQLRLGARGSLERLLANVRVLEEEPDDLGYRPMRRDFSITGTPAIPDASMFYRMIVETVLRFVVPRPNDDNGVEDDDRERPVIPRIPDIFEGIFREIRGR